MNKRSGPRRRGRCAGLGIVVVLLAPLAAQRIPDTRVTSADSAGGLPQIAAAAGFVYVAWAENRAGRSDVYFNRSADGGSTWMAAETRLDTGSAAGAANSFTPRIAAAGNTVYVTWIDERDGNGDVYFNRSLDNGSTWLPRDVRLDTGSAAGAAQSAEPRIAVSATAVHVTWEDDRTSPYWADIYYNRSLDGGTTWLLRDVRLNTGRQPGAARATAPRIAAAGTSVYVTWEDDRNAAARGVFFNRSLDGGATWLPGDVQVNDGPPTNAAQAPAIAAAGDAVFVVWEDSRNGSLDVYCDRSLDHGATWLPNDVRLDAGGFFGGDSRHPEVAVSGTSVFATWDDNRNRGSSDIYFNRSLDAGATWLSSDVRLNTPGFFVAGIAHEPRIVAQGDAVYVAWTDERNTPGVGDIYCNRSLDRGSTWLATDQRLNTGSAAGTASAQRPVIAAAVDAVYVSWWTSRPGGVYVNIPFGFHVYGAGTPGSGGIVPRLRGAGALHPGRVVSVEVSRGVGGTAGALLIGADPASRASQPFLGGTLLVLPAWSVPVRVDGAFGVPGVGTRSLQLSVPPDPTHIGHGVMFQVWLLDAGAPQVFSASNGLETWIG